MSDDKVVPFPFNGDPGQFGAGGLNVRGGGGNDGSMDNHRIEALEKRFDKLESRLDGMQREVGDLRVQIATLTERIAHLPSKEFIYKGIAGLVAAIGALIVLAPKLQIWFGVVSTSN